MIFWRVWNNYESWSYVNCGDCSNGGRLGFGIWDASNLWPLCLLAGDPPHSLARKISADQVHTHNYHLILLSHKCMRNHRNDNIYQRLSFLSPTYRCLKSRQCHHDSSHHLPQNTKDKTIIATIMIVVTTTFHKRHTAQERPRWTHRLPVGWYWWYS